jgi:hypothetical protein
VSSLYWDDALPKAFPAHAHDVLGAMPLALAALALLIYQAPRRLNALEIVKTAILVAAFLFWSANQLLSDSLHATFFNDLAIALFVLDVFLSILSRPPTLPNLAAREAMLPRAQQWAGSSNGAGHHDADVSQGSPSSD